MKTSIILSLLSIVVALCITVLASTPQSPMPTSAPSTEALPTSLTLTEPVNYGLDDEITFTVLSDGIISETTMAEWLPGVVAAEMPVSFDMEALKAQAVAARTYILNRVEKENPNHPEADVCDDPDCCKAHLTNEELNTRWTSSFIENKSIVDHSVEETSGEVLYYEGEVIEAVFHSSSAGNTASAASIWNDVPYLQSVETPETSSLVPNFESSVKLTVTDFAEILAPYGCDLSYTPDTWVGEVMRDDSYRVASIVIGGVELSGLELRELFELRSTYFTLEYSEGVFLFSVIGYGHGVGMSQYGANILANEGYEYTEILAHYYPGTTLHSG